MSTTQIASMPYNAFETAEAISERTAFFIRFLDTVHHLPAVQANHRRTAELFGFKDGFRLLDAGSGIGNFTIDIAPLVGSGGRVVGIDQSADFLSIARQRAQQAGHSIRYVEGDITAMPFADASFDGVRTERVLQYLNEPTLALHEMIRVTKPGGVVIASELDWDTLLFDLPGIEPGIWRKFTAAISDGVGQGWMGRKLHRLFCEAQLVDVTTECFPLVFTDYETVFDHLAGRAAIAGALQSGAVTESETEAVLDSLVQARNAGTFFGAFNLFTTSGRVPPTESGPDVETELNVLANDFSVRSRRMAPGSRLAVLQASRQRRTTSLGGKL
jgi:ubiquinone/menaquinone biosynthesis C-methylase UbiE